MLNKFDLQREVGSLDMLISAVTSEIENESSNALIKEMQEALYRLRQERGIRKILLTALENESDMSMAERRAAGATGQNRRLGHSSIAKLCA